MLAQLATAHPSIKVNGGEVIGVAPAAGFQATHLMDTSVPFELLMDRENRLSRRFEMERQSFWKFLFNFNAWGDYLTALMRNRKQGRITASYAVLPAIAVVDADATVTYLYRGTGIADYPPLAEVLEELAGLQ